MARVRALAASIKNNTSLRDLSLGNQRTEIGQCCEDFIIDAIVSNTILTSLILSGLSDSGGSK